MTPAPKQKDYTTEAVWLRRFNAAVLAVACFFLARYVNNTDNHLERHDLQIAIIDKQVAVNTSEIKSMKTYYETYKDAVQAARDSNMQLTAK